MVLALDFFTHNSGHSLHFFDWDEDFSTSLCGYLFVTLWKASQRSSVFSQLTEKIHPLSKQVRLQSVFYLPKKEKTNPIAQLEAYLGIEDWPSTHIPVFIPVDNSHLLTQDHIGHIGTLILIKQENNLCTITAPVA